MKFLDTDRGDLPTGSLISAATEWLLQCLFEARSAGLLHVVGVCTRESKEDYLTEWLMLELDLQRHLASLKSMSLLAGRTVIVDPGKFTLTFSDDIRNLLSPLSRRELRRNLLRPLKLTEQQAKFIAELPVTLS